MLTLETTEHLKLMQNKMSVVQDIRTAALLVIYNTLPTTGVERFFYFIITLLYFFITAGLIVLRSVDEK